jgi:hypothetical protein
MKIALAALLTVLVASCGSPQPPPVVEAGEVRISGPYVHENLAVYLLHRKEADPQEYLTLHEGLKSGSVAVTEKEQEQVEKLIVENKSDLPLFIQEGDRLQGGKQDRIVGISLVVPPRSGKVPVPAFCVEQSRWTRGAHGGTFVDTTNAAFAGNSVRYAAKVQGSQHEVWEKVAQQKAELNRQNAAPNTNSSLNEALDSKAVMDQAAAYEKALGDFASKHPDAVGVAFALNGKVEETVAYPSASLLRKVYGRLVGSYAIQALSDKKASTAPPAESVAAFMKEGAKKGDETRTVDRDNACRLAQFEKKAYCESTYRGKIVCTQWLAAPADAPAPAPAQAPARQVQEERR